MSMDVEVVIMSVAVDEIAPDIYRLSVYVPEADFTFNQFLIDDEEPLLFHTGPRGCFPWCGGGLPDTSRRAAPLDHLRTRRGRRVRLDEPVPGRRPPGQVAHGVLGCMVSFNDLCDRPPRAARGRRGRSTSAAIGCGTIDTPHVPHGWEARVLFDETTDTLLSGDLFTAVGQSRPLVESEMVGPAMRAEDLFSATCLTPDWRDDAPPGRPDATHPCVDARAFLDRLERL